MNLNTDINISLRRALLACGAFVVGMLTSTADAQFTYTPGNLIGSQTYDGLGVDAALNPDTVGSLTGNGDGDYIGNGLGDGLLTVLSGTLTINASDCKLPNFGGAYFGTINVGSNATFNLNMVGDWSFAIAQGGDGSMTISNGATVNYLSAGTNEQRFSVGNSGGGYTGILTILGGTLNVNLDPGTTLSDDERGFDVGASGGVTGTINLVAGTLNDNMPLPFALGGQYSGMNTSPVFNANTSVNIFNISNGVFVMTNICATTDTSEATFTVGGASYVNFLTGGTGQLSLVNYQLYDYAGLISAGSIQVNGNPALIGQFTYSMVGNQGTLQLNPAALVAPFITTQPQPVTAYAGHYAQFSVSVGGGVPVPAYQWQGGPVGGPYSNLVNGAKFSGTTNLTLTISNLTQADPVEYVLVASNIVGSAQSSGGDLTVLSVPPSSGPYQSSVLALNPVAYWPLNDNAVDPFSGAAPVYDAAGTQDGLYLQQAADGYDGILGPQSTDGYPQFTDGLGALSTLGYTANSWAIVPALNFNTNTVTILMWVNPDGPQANAAGLFLDRNTGNQDGVCYADANQHLGYIWNNNDAATYSFIGPVIPVNIWSLIAVVISPTNASFYVINANGLGYANFNHAHNNVPWSGDVGPDPNIRIGSDPAVSPGRNFNGTIGQVAVFNYDLTISQIINLSGLTTLPPGVSVQTGNATIYAGQTAAFTGSTAGVPAPSVQWTAGPIGGPYTNLVDGGNISGATNLTLTIADATVADTLELVLVATNINGSAQSSPVDLTVNPLPSGGAIALVDNSGVTAFNNGTSFYLVTNLTVSVAASTLVVEAVFRNSTGSLTEAPSTLNWTNGTATNVLKLSGVVYSDAAGGHGRNVAIYYTNNPTSGSGFNISGQLLSASSGQLLAFTLSGVDTTAPAVFNSVGNSLSGPPTLSFTQFVAISNSWAAVGAAIAAQQNILTPLVTSIAVSDTNGDTAGTPVYTSGTGGFSSPSSASLGYIGNLEAGSDLFTYTMAPNTGGAQSFAAAIFSPPTFAPVVTIQPQPAAAYPGRTVSFSVTASGATPKSYFWRTNGVIIPADGGSYSGSTITTLTVNPVFSGMPTNYDVLISNSYGSVVSSVAELTVLPLSGAYSSSVLALNPVAYWPLDESADPSTGTAVAADAAGTFNARYGAASLNAFDGVVGPQPANGYPQFSVGEGALETVAAANSWVNTPALNLDTKTVTITMWVYPNGNQANSTGLYMNRNSAVNDGVGYGSSQRMGYTWNNNQAATYNYNGGPIIPTNEWSFLAWVMTPTNTVFYCINTNGTSSSVASQTNYTELWSGSASPDANIRIGSDPSVSPGRNFVGIIDEVAVFNYDLTSSQVQNLTGLTFVSTNAATAGFMATVTGSPGSQVLNFSWAPDHLGWQLYTNAVGLTAVNSWFPVAGSATVVNKSITINESTTNVFFQLRYP